MKRFILGLFLIMILSGVANAMEKIDMSVQDIIMQQPEAARIYTNHWSNDKISIQTRLTWVGVWIRITNNTEQPILLIWNKSVMVDVDGNSSRLIPGETRKIDAARSVPETMIPPHTSYSEMAVSTGCLAESLNDYKFLLNYPVEKNFFGNMSSMSSINSKKYKDFVLQYKDRTLSMILCLNINGQDEYYNFNMALDFYKKIDEVTVSLDGKTETPRTISLGWELDGAKIKDIKEGQAAGKAGLATDDLILEINGRTFSEVEQPKKLVESRFSAGHTVMLLIERDGEKKMITLKK